MPSNDEKLDVLEKIIYDDATRAREAILALVRQDSDQRLAGIKEEIARDAEQDYRKESQRSLQEKDSRISKANINARKMLMSARNDIISSVLYELSERLASFTRTTEYRGYLEQNIREAYAISVGYSVIGAEAGANSVTGATNGANSGSTANAILGSGAEASHVVILMTPADYEAYAAHARGLAPGADIRPGDAAMIGGVKAENAVKGVYVDNTMQKKVELCVDELYRISGLTIKT